MFKRDGNVEWVPLPSRAAARVARLGVRFEQLAERKQTRLTHKVKVRLVGKRGTWGEWSGAARSGSDVERLHNDSLLFPVLVGAGGQRRWWWYRDNFYVEDENMSVEQVRTLAEQEIRRRRRRDDRAATIDEQQAASAGATREAVHDDVKMFVWQRDQGQCVNCGSRERLEFDHIIPLSMGGGNSARNLQLLCENCNRLKGGNLV